jgi:5-methylcytosine-specific restriction endonuclease McrA
MSQAKCQQCRVEVSGTDRHATQVYCSDCTSKLTCDKCGQPRKIKNRLCRQCLVERTRTRRNEARKDPAELVKVASQKRDYERRKLIARGKPTPEQRAAVGALKQLQLEQRRKACEIAKTTRLTELERYRIDVLYREKEKARFRDKYKRQAVSERARTAKYKVDNPQRKEAWELTRKAREVAQSDGSVTPLALKVLREAASRCHYCQTTLGTSKSIDHKTPLCVGGAHSMSNLAITCKRCNTRKGRLTEQQFRVRIEGESSGGLMTRSGPG